MSQYDSFYHLVIASGTSREKCSPFHSADQGRGTAEIPHAPSPSRLSSTCTTNKIGMYSQAGEKQFQSRAARCILSREMYIFGGEITFFYKAHGCH